MCTLCTSIIIYNIHKYYAYKASCLVLIHMYDYGKSNEYITPAISVGHSSLVLLAETLMCYNNQHTQHYFCAQMGTFPHRQCKLNRNKGAC